jgi:hypothetical protein
MSTITAKNVRTLAFGGGVANFMGITGNSHKYFWLSTDLIKLMLDRHIKVYERLLPTEEQAKNADGDLLWYYTDADGNVINVASGTEPVPGTGDVPADVTVNPVMVTVETGEVELDEDNYESDNGGEELAADSDIVVIQDLEGQRQAEHDAEKAAYLEALGLEIKKKQDEMQKEEEEEVETGEPETPELEDGPTGD